MPQTIRPTTPNGHLFTVRFSAMDSASILALLERQAAELDDTDDAEVLTLRLRDVRTMRTEEGRLCALRDAWYQHDLAQYLAT